MITSHSFKHPKRIPDTDRLSFRLSNLAVAAVVEHLGSTGHGRPPERAVEEMEILVERIIRRELGRYSYAEPPRPEPSTGEEVADWLRRHLPKVACEGCKQQQGAALLSAFAEADAEPVPSRSA